MPAMSYTPPTPGDPTTESSWGDSLNIIFDQIEAAIQQLQIPLGAIEDSDDATAVAGRLPSPAGFRRVVVQADPNTGAVELRDGGGDQIANILLVVDAYGAPIAWVQNAGGLGVNDRLSTFRGLFSLPGWQADIYGYIRRNGHAEFSWPGPAGNLLSHQDATQETFEGLRSGGLGTWQIPFGAGTIARVDADPMDLPPSGSFSVIRVTATTTSLVAVCGLTPLGSPIYPATAGEVYSSVGHVLAEDTARDVEWGLQFFEDDGTFISTLYGSPGDTTLDAWALGSSGGLTAPALTAWAAPVVRFATTAAAEDFLLSAVGLYRGDVAAYGPPFVGSGTYGVWGEAAVNDRWHDSGTDTDYVCTTGGIPQVQVWEVREAAGPDISTDDPLPLGTADPGSTGETADAGHVHPAGDFVTGDDLAAALVTASAPALRSWRSAVANRPYGIASTVWIGSSTTAGTGASTRTRRYSDLVAGDLQRRYSPTHAAGGVHILGTDTGWTTSGTVGTDAHGLGLASKTLATGATMSRTETCTGFDVHYAQGPGAGAFDVSIDGGSAVTVTPDTTGTANRHDGVYSSPTVTSGSHSILITASAATVISGVYARGGDETAGIRSYMSGLGGATSATFAAGADSFFQRLAALSARLVAIMVGSNDYATGISPASMKTNLQSFIDKIVSAVSPTPSILLVGTYLRLDVTSPSYPWSDYLEAYAEVAADNPGLVDYIDISAPYPATVIENQGDHLIGSDLIHMGDRGHRLMADLILSRLIEPAPVALPALTFDPRRIGGLLTWLDASTLGLADNTAVATWGAQGLERAALTQGTSGNRPVYRTSRVNGRPAVVFTAANNHYLSSATWAAKRSTPLTVFSVAKLVSGNTGNIYTGQSGVYAYAGNNTSGTLAVGSGGIAEITTSITMDAWHVIATVYNGASSSIWLDSDSATATGTTTTGTNSALPGLRLGTNSAASSNWLDGEIAELAVYHRALTAEEIAAMMVWLGARYGITIT